VDSAPTGPRRPSLAIPKAIEHDYDWRRFAEGHGSLNPRGEVQLGFPSPDGDGNEY
jgi:hypothetical protein